jgi:hypothetical protein
MSAEELVEKLSKKPTMLFKINPRDGWWECTCCKRHSPDNWGHFEEIVHTTVCLVVAIYEHAGKGILTDANVE